MKKDFIKISFHSKLFKGRSNWYFCYLKSEKLAHVLALLSERTVSEPQEGLEACAAKATQVAQDVVYAAAGEVTEEALLAGLFSMLWMLRLSASQGYLGKETAKILTEEYEGVIERLVGDSRHLGLSVSPQDLAVPLVAEEPLLEPLPSLLGLTDSSIGQKDIYKRQISNRTQKDIHSQKGQVRAALILDLIKKSDGVSIKDISLVVRDCSEKTIQRELNSLIERGVVVRRGERRWSTYHPV